MGARFPTTPKYLHLRIIASSFHQMGAQLGRNVKNLTTSPEESNSQIFLTGLRGILVLESGLWIFFQTFIPGLTSDIPSPHYQQVLRKVLQVLFWDYSLIASFYLMLSARTICVPFLTDASSSNYARALICRPIQIGIPLFVAAAIAFILFNQIGGDFVARFASNYSNPLIQSVYLPPSGLAVVNSIYNTLWIVRDFSSQAANRAWPSMTLWSPSLIYSQSYTVFIAMVILPFTRPRWHIQGLSLFIIAAWWMNSWGWYSMTGLMLADISVNHILKDDLNSGFQIARGFFIGNRLIGVTLAAGGLTMKYVWVAARPDMEHAEVASHPSLHLSDNFTVDTFDTSSPYPRIDNYLLILGVLLLIEILEPMQKGLSNKSLVFLGKRSFSEQSPLS
jgi:hypothetical protein